jgi:hypothetical protein
MQTLLFDVDTLNAGVKTISIIKPSLGITLFLLTDTACLRRTIVTVEVRRRNLAVRTFEVLHCILLTYLGLAEVDPFWTADPPILLTFLTTGATTGVIFLFFAITLVANTDACKVPLEASAFITPG